MKFRISLSQEQIQFILSCPDVPADLKKQLELALFKAGNGYLKPAYEITGRQASLTPKTKRDLPLETKYQMALHYVDAGEPVPPELFPAYTEYRYLNDMMDAEEAAEYESREGF